MPEKQYKKVQNEHLRRELPEGVEIGDDGIRSSYVGEEGPDGIARPWLVRDSKSRNELPQYLLKALDKIVLQATWPYGKLCHLNRNVNTIPATRLGIVRYHVNGTRYDDDVIMIKAVDFETWFL